MATYSEIKSIISNNVQTQVRALINYPTVIIERQITISPSANPSPSNPPNPFLNPSGLPGGTAPQANIQVIREQFECIYSAGRNYIVEQDQKLGLSPSLTVYIKYDDVKNSSLGKILETDYVVFKGERYTIKALSNLYEILQMLKLK